MDHLVFRSGLLMCVVAMVLACTGQEPRPEHFARPMAEYTLRLSKDLTEEDARSAELGASRWAETGAVTFVMGEAYDGEPGRVRSGCTTTIFVGWTEPTDPHLTGPIAKSVAFSEDGCTLRKVSLVRGRVEPGDVAKVVSHEVGHAMGLDHVPNGVMHPNEDGVSGFVTCDDAREFCRVYGCEVECTR